MVPLFQVISPTACPEESLKINDNYCRHILSSYGVLQIPVVYWKSSCGKFYSDTIVTGNNNYSDELKEKEYYTRYDGKSGLHNTRRIGEIWIPGEESRAPTVEIRSNKRKCFGRTEN